MTVTPISFPVISTGSINAGVDPANLVPAAATAPVSTGSTDGTHDFGQMLISGIDHLEGLSDNAANLSVKAATGDLTSIHDYTIAATEASTATQLTVAVTNKAIESFNAIMNMQV